MNADSDPLTSAFAAVSRAEAALRDAVRVDFSRMEGPLWMARIPEEFRSRWLQRYQVDEANGLSRSPELIEYADVADLQAVITRDWQVFASRFGERETALAELEQFRLLRNAVMHRGARMSPRECSQAGRVAGTILEKCRAEISYVPHAAPALPPVERRQKRSSTERQTLLYRSVERVLAQMSGRLMGERNAVVRYLRQNLGDCSPDTLAAIIEKFGAMPGTQSVVEELHRDLPPARPAPPPLKSRKLADWLKWADTHYMPYRRWLLRTGHQDTEVAKWALDYEDWLVASYPGFLQGASIDNTVLGVYLLVEQQLLEGARVIWLVVDNLCGLWRSEFQSALSEAGLQMLKAQRALSMLPSSTHISRRAMLSGRVPSETDKHLDEEDACRKLWRERGFPSIAYCTQFEQVELTIPTPVPLIVFVYNWIDRLAHMPDDPGFNREEQMRLAMGTLAVKIGNAVRTMRQAGPARLVVSTDHGATRPDPTSEVITVPISAIPAGADPDEYRRYVFTSQTTGLNSTDWHILKSTDCALPSTAAVARGQRYVNALPRAFVHGGLSPEETVVNILIAEISAREPLQLVLSQASPSLRRGRPGHLRILVRNPFDMPVERLILTLPDYGVTFGAFDIPPRSELTTDEQTVTLDPDMEVSNRVGHLTCTGSYLIAGQPALLSERLPIEIQEIYRPAMDDFGDMFNG